MDQRPNPRVGTFDDRLWVLSLIAITSPGTLEGFHTGLHIQTKKVSHLLTEVLIAGAYVVC